MSAPLTIQRLDASRIGQAVDLVRNSFDARLLPYMIYGQSGVERYLESAQPRVGVAGGREGWVALDSGAVVGYAEFDLARLPTAHLAYVCVASSHRGDGLARRMIERFAAECAAAMTLSLDVFDGNTAAKGLYDRLGLSAEGAAAEWIVRPLPAPEARPLLVEELPQSLAVHSVFGFSSLRIHHGDRLVTVGRLGEAVLRTSSPAEFFDDDLLAALRAVFPTLREALLVTTEAGRAGWLPTQTQTQTLTRSTRLSGSIGSELRGGSC